MKKDEKSVAAQLQFAISIREKNIEEMRNSASETLRAAVDYFSEVREFAEKERKEIEVLKEFLGTLKVS